MSTFKLIIQLSLAILLSFTMFTTAWSQNRERSDKPRIEVLTNDVDITADPADSNFVIITRIHKVRVPKVFTDSLFVHKRMEIRGKIQHRPPMFRKEWIRRDFRKQQRQHH